MPSFRKRGDKWYFRIRVKNIRGENVIVEKVGGTTKPEARDACRMFIRKTDQFGRIVGLENLEYADYLDRWLEHCVCNILKPNTVNSYESIVRNHLKPLIGKWKIAEIRKPILQSFLNSMLKKYSVQTVDLMRGIITSSFRDAVNTFEYLERSPAKGLRISKNAQESESENTQEVKIFSQDEIRTIFHQFPIQHVFFMPTRLAYYTGMRLGECLALKWDDVNMEQRIISVKHNLYDKKGTPKIGRPKSKSSTRQIPFGDELCKVLLQYHAYQVKERLQCGPMYKKTDYVCTKKNGDIVTSNDMRYFGIYCKKELSGGSFHTFRHTHATLLLENGWALVDVSKRLGHSSVEITSKIYYHITMKAQEKIREKLNDIFSDNSFLAASGEKT